MFCALYLNIFILCFGECFGRVSLCSVCGGALQEASGHSVFGFPSVRRLLLFSGFLFFFFCFDITAYLIVALAPLATILR